MAPARRSNLAALAGVLGLLLGGWLVGAAPGAPVPLVAVGLVVGVALMCAGTALVVAASGPEVDR